MIGEMRSWECLVSLVESYEVKHSKIFVETIAKIKWYINDSSKVKSMIREIQKSLNAESLESSKKEEVQNQIR